jgi:hypothetical protein
MFGRKFVYYLNHICWPKFPIVWEYFDQRLVNVQILVQLIGLQLAFGCIDELNLATASFATGQSEGFCAMQK